MTEDPLELLLQISVLVSLLWVVGHGLAVLALWRRRAELPPQNLRSLRQLLQGGSAVMIVVIVEFLVGLFFDWGVVALLLAALSAAWAVLLNRGAQTIPGPMATLADRLRPGERWGDQRQPWDDL